MGRRHTFQPDSFWLPEREHYAHITDFNSYNYLTLAVACAGYIHLARNMHVDPLIYFRSKCPLDITTLVNV
ncbi:MAG: BNR-4 repeat-containing protein [Candidatus Malihini olakiniferum]